MTPRILGAHPFAHDQQRRLCTRIATIFPSGNVLVTLPGIHATQRMAYLDWLTSQRSEAGLPPLPREESMALWCEAVDLIIDHDAIVIRPDPDNMALAFRADELLQEIVPKHKIKFLFTLHAKVYGAIKRRGECWRINSLPKSRAEVEHLIEAAKIGISGHEIYYYNRNTGTRILTCDEFGRLGGFDDEQLRRQLLEIQEHSGQQSRRGGREIEFFAADTGFTAADLAACDFRSADAAGLRAVFARLREQFAAAVEPDYREDCPAHAPWRNRMYAALIGQDEQTVSEEKLLGLSSEFFMQIQWLPGARIEEGELIFDPFFDLGPAAEPSPAAGIAEAADSGVAALWDEKCRGIIINYVREYGDLEYINVGRVVDSLSQRETSFGRRDVYIAVLKRRSSAHEVVNIIRMQKWGVREHLDEGRDLLDSMIRSEEYTDYIFDRRMGCRQLSMNLCPMVTARKLTEKYHGSQAAHQGATIWSTYFKRDYVRGIASDKVPQFRFASPDYAVAFARLLGQAAAANMIVGRFGLAGHVLFDDGDEVIIDGPNGLPVDIVVADLTGTFGNYDGDLAELAGAYAEPILQRLTLVTNPEAFINAYLEAFEERFLAVQQEYARRRRAFDTLFDFRGHGEPGSFPYRWRCVLDRLARADAHHLKECIREFLNCGV